jgi:hypothetical protein
LLLDADERTALLLGKQLSVPTGQEAGRNVSHGEQQQNKSLAAVLPTAHISFDSMVIWGNGGIAPPFFILALHGGEWSTSCSS